MLKLVRSLVALALLLIAVPAVAAPVWTQYSAKSFSQAQTSGKKIVVDVHADWCPTCRAQEPTLDALRQDRRLKNVVFIRVDFDKDKEFLRQHRVPRQSTVLVFKGKRETARSIAETRPAQLRAAILAGL